MSDAAHQQHYESNAIQPIELFCLDFPEEQFFGYLRGNVMKYIMRYKEKGGAEDLRKAEVYLGWLIEYYEKHGITVSGRFVSRRDEA